MVRIACLLLLLWVSFFGVSCSPPGVIFVKSLNSHQEASSSSDDDSYDPLQGSVKIITVQAHIHVHNIPMQEIPQVPEIEPVGGPIHIFDKTKPLPIHIHSKMGADEINNAMVASVNNLKQQLSEDNEDVIHLVKMVEILQQKLQQCLHTKNDTESAPDNSTKNGTIANDHSSIQNDLVTEQLNSSKNIDLSKQNINDHEEIKPTPELSTDHNIHLFKKESNNKPESNNHTVPILEELMESMKRVTALNNSDGNSTSIVKVETPNTDNKEITPAIQNKDPTDDKKDTNDSDKKEATITKDDKHDDAKDDKVGKDNTGDKDDKSGNNDKQQQPDTSKAESQFVVALNNDNWQQMIYDNDKPAIVEFYASWCGSCEDLEPEFAKSATALRGMVLFGTVNCDDDKNRELCKKYKVKEIPTLKTFPAGRLTKENTNGSQNYEGERTADSLEKAAVDLLSEEDYKAFLSMNESTNKTGKSNEGEHVNIFFGQDGKKEIEKPNDATQSGVKPVVVLDGWEVAQNDELTDAANSAKEQVQEAVNAANNSIGCYEIINGTKQVVAGINYRIKVKIGDNRFCELLIYRSSSSSQYETKEIIFNPPLKVADNATTNTKKDESVPISTQQDDNQPTDQKLNDTVKEK